MSCDDVDLMPTIDFMLRGADGNDYWAEWMPEDYLIEIGTTQECQMCMYSHSGSTLTLGSSFLKGYYAQFDKTAGTIGLAPSTNSPKEDLTQGTAPTRLRGYDVATVAGLATGMAVLLGLFLWMIFGIFCFMMLRNTKMAKGP